MGEDNFARSQSIFANEIIDALGERGLLILVRRARVNNQELFRTRDQVTVRMGCRRLGRRAHGEADVVWLKLHSPVRPALRCRIRQETRDCLIVQTCGQGFHRVQHRRHYNDFAPLPTRVGIACGDPFAAFQFGICGGLRFLLRRTMSEKEPGIKTSRRKWRGHPAAGKSEIIRIEMQPIMIEQLRPVHAARFKIVE